MKILIVDDEDLVRRALARALKNQGYEVLEAKDGGEGLEFWQQSAPDLVLLDVVMPVLTGPQVLEKMGPRNKTKVIIMTAYAGGMGAQLTERDYDAYLQKPFEDIFQVVKKVEKLLDGK